MTTATDYLFEKTLQLLSNKERKGFEPWLNATLGRSKPKLQAMYRHWREGKDWEAIADKLGLTPATAPTQRKLTRLRGELQEQIELYLSWLAFQKEKDLQRRMLLTELVHRDATYHFPMLLKKYQKAREEGSLRARGYFEAAYWEETIRQVFLVKYPPHMRRGEHLVDTRLTSWLAWHEFEVLDLGLAAEAVLAPERERLRHLAQSFADASDQPPATLCLMRDLYQLYREQTWQKETPDQDEALIARLITLRDQFDPDAFTNVFMHALNYLLRKTRYLSSRLPHQQALDLSRWGLQQQILPMNRAIYWSVTNLMANVILLTQSKSERVQLGAEAKHFLQNQLEHLPEAEREKSYQHSYAVIQFVLGHYDDLGVDLTESSFKDPYYDLGCDSLLLKVAIETENLKGIKYEIHRLKMKIGRTPGTSELFKQAYLNQLNLISDLTKTTNRREREDLLRRIQTTHPLEGRVWLHQKVKAQLE